MSERDPRFPTSKSAVSRRSFLETLSAAGFAGLTGLAGCRAVSRAGPGVSRSSHPRPNIVIVLADDQRYDGLHVTGHAYAETPNTDRLAAEGVLFTNAVVSTPLCAPNRACLYTGTFAHAHGNRNNGAEHYLPHEDVRPPMPVPCFPAILRDTGYATAFFGKWHAGERSYPDAGFQHFEPSGARYRTPSFWNGETWVTEEGFLPDRVAAKAAAWIRRNAGRPFLIVAAHTAPHLPVEVPERYGNLYRGCRPFRPPSESDDCSDKSQFVRNARQWFLEMRGREEIPPSVWPPPVTDEQHRRLMRLNRTLDDSVGVIREALEETGELDRTVFIYHSDNGFFLGEHGLSAKYYPYEEALRVPLVIRYPREISPGLRLDVPVYTLDLAPSILEWTGISIPSAMQGRSLSSIIRSKGASPWREATLHEYFHHKGDVPPIVWISARTNRWSYSRFAKPLDEELYDLQQDPYQMKNLVHSADHVGRLSEMRDLLDRLVTQTRGEVIPVPA